MLGHALSFDIAAGPNFAGDNLGDVFRPVLKRVEGNDADRIVELPRREVGDDSFEVCPLDFGFAVDATTQLTEAVDHEVNGLIRPIRHDRGLPAGLTHREFPTPQTRI